MHTGPAPKFIHKPLCSTSAWCVYGGLEKICEQYWISWSERYPAAAARHSPTTHTWEHLLRHTSHAHPPRAKQTKLRWKWTYIRLLEGILRPSLNQVICGLGKLCIRGARMRAPSPWDTVWDLSPSTKPPISSRNKEKHVRREKMKY